MSDPKPSTKSNNDATQPLPAVGVVVICHGNLGQELINAMEFIVGPQKGIVAIATGRQYDIEKLHREIEKAIESVNQGGGVLILTDMFGGTPSNLGLAFLDESRVEILTGVNLPMMIKLAKSRPRKDIRDLAEFLKGYGQRNIVLASDILKPKNIQKKSNSDTSLD